jgi:hypothetical protein
VGSSEIKRDREGQKLEGNIHAPLLLAKQTRRLQRKKRTL